MEQMEMVHVLDHPLLQHKLSILRDETTGVKDFREIVCEIATLMCYDATRNLPLQAVEVQTPVAKAVTYQLAGKKLAIVPVLRAGLGMVEGILTLIPSAKVGHIGLFRDPDTLEPVKYYCKMPTDIADRDVIILDPMLATGGSASAAVSVSHLSWIAFATVFHSSRSFFTPSRNSLSSNLRVEPRRANEILREASTLLSQSCAMSASSRAFACA